MEEQTMKFKCPTIRFGRRTSEGNADFYDILSKSPDFPVEVEMLFRQRVCQSVQWICGDNDDEIYPDSFLLWKCSTAQILVARLIDAGCDSRDRPHSIGIEAGLVEIDKIEKPVDFLARIVQTPDWPDGTISENQEESPRMELIERYFLGPEKSLLLASHSRFLASGVDCVDSPVRLETIQPVRQPVFLPPLSPPSSPVEKQSGLPRLLGELAVLLFLGGVILFLYTELAKREEQTRRERKEHQTTKEYLEQERKALIKEKEDREFAVRQLEETKRKLEKSIEQQKRELKEKDELLEEAKKDADAGLRKENEMLRQKNDVREEAHQKLERKLDRIRAVLSENDTE